VLADFTFQALNASEFRMMFAGRGMSDDLIELEPLLAQYDPGEILIGPLLSLSFGSNFRYFYIAGKGSKVYGSIGLGFIELEDDAQRQRVDIIEKLKSRFRKAVILGSHLEMAEAVHKLWPNEETSRILELAALEPQPTKAGRDSSFGDHNNEVIASGEFLGLKAQERIGHGQHQNSVLVAGATLTDDQRPPLAVRPHAESLAPSGLPNVTSSWPCTDRSTATPQERQSEHNQDAVPMAVLELLSLIPVDDVPKQPVAGGESLTSTAVRTDAAGGVIVMVAVLLAGMMVFFSSTEQVADDTLLAGGRAPLTTVNQDNGPSQSTGPIAKGNKSGPSVGSASVAPPSQSLPSQMASAGVRNAPTSTPQSPPRLPAAPTEIAPASSPQAQPPETGNVAPTTPPTSAVQSPPPRKAASVTGIASASGSQSQPPKATSIAPRTAPNSVAERPPSLAFGAATGTESSGGTRSSPEMQLNADAIAVLISRAEDLMKSGDFASARLLLRRAANAGSANAALTLGATFDPRVIDEIGPIGIEPDIARARQWYEMAAELGSELAVQRLTNLQMAR